MPSWDNREQPLIPWDRVVEVSKVALRPNDQERRERVAVSKLEPSGCWIILGPPGSGKSTLLHQILDGDEASALLHLHDFNGMEALERELAREPAFQKWQAGGVLRLGLDALDEATFDPSTFGRALVRRLREWGAERLHLILTCRDSAWPGSLKEELARLFTPKRELDHRSGHPAMAQVQSWDRGGDLGPSGPARERHFGVALPSLPAVRGRPGRALRGPNDDRGPERAFLLRLQPLTDEEVQQAATDRIGSRARSFLDAMKQADVLELLRDPDCLFKVLEERRHGETGIPDRVELYQRLIRRHCDELNDDRRRLLKSSVDERLDAAKWVAAAIVLGNRTGLRSDTSIGKEDPWIEQEQLWSRSKSSVCLVPSRELLQETLRTRLFDHPSGRTRFVVRLHAEFLAACWLKDHLPSEPALVNLFLHGSPGGPLVPQLTSTAQWLARIEPRFDLVRLSPETALRVDLTTDASRETLLELLIDRVNRGRVNQYGSVDGSRLNLLIHPAISAQLLRWLARSDLSLEALNLVVRVAAVCQRQELIGPLRSIAGRPEVELRCRERALHGYLELVQQHRPDQPPDVADFLTDPTDADDELFGLALNALWPRWISTGPLLARLRAPRRPTLYGVYRLFLRHQLVERASQDQLDEVLQRVAHITTDRSPAEGEHGWLRYCLPSFVKAAATLAPRPDRFRVIAQLIAAAESEDGPPRWLHELRLPEPVSVEVAIHLLQLAPESRSASALIAPANVLRALVDRQISGLESVARAWTDLSDEQQVTALYGWPDAWAGLPQDFREIAAQRGLAAAAAEQRRLYDLYCVESPPADPPPWAQLRETLEHADSKPTDWYEIAPLLDRSSGATSYLPRAPVMDLPGWAALTLEERERVRAAARRFITVESPYESAWLERADILSDWPKVAVQALELLTDLPADTWARWTGALVTRSDAILHEGKRRGLIAACLEQAEPAVLSAVRRRVRACAHPNALCPFRLDPAFATPRVLEVLHQALVEIDVPHRAFTDVLAVLLQAKHTGTRRWLDSLLETQRGQPTWEESAVAGLICALRFDEDRRDACWERLSTAPDDVQRRAITELLPTSYPVAPPAPGFRPRDHRLILHHLYRLFPDPPPNPPDRVHVTTAEEERYRARCGLENGLSDDGQPGSVEELELLRDAHPDREYLIRLVADARRATLQQTWSPGDPVQLLIALASDKGANHGQPRYQADACTESPMASPPRVFISYAWGDEDTWVEEFATRLRADGVDARLDKWELAPGDEIAVFMEKQVRESAFVLFICTPRFKAKADERKGGVGYEAMIATAEVLARREEVARKFIPVHRSGDWVNAAASWLLGKYLIDLRGAPYAEANYQHLLGALLNRRRGPPPIGTPATPAGGYGVAPPPSPSSPVAASDPKARAALERLLLDLFSLSELRRFITHQPGGDDLAAHLPSSGSPAEYAHELVALLQRRGHINGELFDAIVAERRSRSADVATVRRQFGL